MAAALSPSLSCGRQSVALRQVGAVLRLHFMRGLAVDGGGVSCLGGAAMGSAPASPPSVDRRRRLKS